MLKPTNFTKHIFYLLILALFSTLTITPLFAASEFELHYTKGVKAHDEGKLDEAKKELEAAVSIKPESSEANYALGVVYMEQGNHKEALKKFRTVYKKDKTSQDLNYRVGLTYYNLEKYDKSEKFLKKELKQAKTQEIKDECHFFLGKIYQKKGKTDLAKKEFALVSSKSLKKEEKIKGKRWFFNAYPGLQFDSNVGLIAKGVATPPDLSGKASPRIYISFAAGYIPLLKANHVLKASYRYYHGFNLINDLDAFDIDQHRVSLDSICIKSMKKGALKFYNSFFYEVGMISRSFNFYNQSFGLNPRAEMVWGKHMTTEFRLPISYDDFYRSAFPEDNRDAFHLGVGAENSWRFNKNKTRVYISFDYERNFAKGYNFDYDAYIPALGYEAKDLVIIDRMNFDVSYARRNFINFQPSPQREDNTVMVMITFNWKVFKHFDLNLNNTFIYNESIAGYSYNRNITSLILGIFI